MLLYNGNEFQQKKKKRMIEFWNRYIIKYENGFIK